jgi:hypothetical protein
VADTTDGLAGFGTATAELAEAEVAARALGWPVRAVCEAAVARYRAQAAAQGLRPRLGSPGVPFPGVPFPGVPFPGVPFPGVPFRAQAARLFLLRSASSRRRHARGRI